MDANAVGRTVLAVDGVGCLGAAAALLADRRVGDLVHPSTAWRGPVIAALAATSSVLLVGAAARRPRDAALRRASLINGGWVLACAIASTRSLSRTGRVLVATTAVLDGAVGAAQWSLQG